MRLILMAMKVLVLTNSDDCAGPMAAAFLRDYGQDLNVVSAGHHAASCLHPLVVPAMKECLVNLENTSTNPFENLDVSAFDFVYEPSEVDVPDDMDTFRIFRDRVKNESFLFYRDVLRKAKS